MKKNSFSDFLIFLAIVGIIGLGFVLVKQYKEQLSHKKIYIRVTAVIHAVDGNTIKIEAEKNNGKTVTIFPNDKRFNGMEKLVTDTRYENPDLEREQKMKEGMRLYKKELAKEKKGNK